MRDALAAGRAGGCAGLRGWLGLERFHSARQTRIAGQKMSVAGLLGAGLAGKNFDERGLALHQVLQTGLHGAQVVEGMHAFGAGAKFAGSLGAAKQQNAEDSDLVAVKVESFLEAVFVLGYAVFRGADGTGQGLTV